MQRSRGGLAGLCRGKFVKHLCPEFGRLCPRQHVLIAQDECGHARNTAFAGVGIACADILGICIAGEKLGDHRPVQPGLLRDFKQGVSIADIATLLEIGAEQRIDDPRLATLDPGPVNQAMRVQRVGRAPDGIEIDVLNDLINAAMADAGMCARPEESSVTLTGTCVDKIGTYSNY